jgi:uncharacterized protein
MVIAPALYQAHITHRRSSPVDHRFRYGTYLWLIDTDAPPRLPWALRALARFPRADHLDVRQLLAEAGIDAPRVLMLASPRTLGFAFNPLSVHWCYLEDGQLAAKVAEVHNTYGERHAYLLPPDPSAEVTKSLFVSPFHPRHGRYRIRISDPGEHVHVSVQLDHVTGKPFTATMTCRRVVPTISNLLRMAVRYPGGPLRVAVLIRWQALRLTMRRVPRYPR